MVVGRSDRVVFFGTGCSMCGRWMEPSVEQYSCQRGDVDTLDTIGWLELVLTLFHQLFVTF